MQVEIYDYRSNWEQIIPILKKKHIQDILEKDIKSFIKNNQIDELLLSEKCIPWLLDTKDIHHNRIIEITNESPEWKEYSKNKSPEWLDDHQDEWLAYYNRIFAKYQPKEYEIEFYQFFGGCHSLASWQKNIAKTIYPKSQVDIYRDNDHSFAFSRLKDLLIIFDVLYFESKPYQHDMSCCL